MYSNKVCRITFSIYYVTKLYIFGNSTSKYYVYLHVCAMQ